MSAQFISVIVPAFNEAENLRLLLPALFENLGRTGRPYEVIVVDDGSTDQTVNLLGSFARPELRLVQLRRNTGQTAALMAGMIPDGVGCVPGRSSLGEHSDA